MTQHRAAVSAAAVKFMANIGTTCAEFAGIAAASELAVTYFASGVLAHPHWGAAARGLVVPGLPLQRHALIVATATVGTTLAPWRLAFIQSYGVDKRLRPSDLALERVDVIAGAVMTGVIGFFIVIACAATLHVSGRSINDAGDAAAWLPALATVEVSQPQLDGGLGPRLHRANFAKLLLRALSVRQSADST